MFTPVCHYGYWTKTIDKNGFRPNGKCNQIVNLHKYSKKSASPCRQKVSLSSCRGIYIATLNWYTFPFLILILRIMHVIRCKYLEENMFGIFHLLFRQTDFKELQRWVYNIIRETFSPVPSFYGFVFNVSLLSHLHCTGCLCIWHPKYGFVMDTLGTPTSLVPIKRYQV